MAYRPDAYTSPRIGETQKEAHELSSCEISIRSVLYYYLELLQQRRICEAAVNNDARSQSIVDIHNYLMEKAPAYAERCCFTEMPLFSEPLPNGSVEGEGDESADLVSSRVQEWCSFFPDFLSLLFVSSNTAFLLMIIMVLRNFDDTGVCVDDHFPMVYT